MAKGSVVCRCYCFSRTWSCLGLFIGLLNQALFLPLIKLFPQL